MTYDVGMTTTARAPLTRERIIGAAVEFADEHGIEVLSMRKLGSELGVEAMSLYNHVANKDDIYDGMIDHVFSSIQLPSTELPWKDQIREIGRDAMARFSSHEWVVVLLMQRGNFGPGALSFMDHVLGILLDAGFDDVDSHHAWQMLASHTMGYAFQQGARPDRSESEFAAIQAQMALMGEQFPHVVQLAPLLAECAYDSEYVFGLEIILDGLEARLS